MPVHESAAKRVRQTARRRAVNRARMDKVRKAVKQAEAAIAAGDMKKAVDLVRMAESALAKGGKAGVMSKKAASRKTSRLTKRLKTTAKK
ncbi:MAG: 30S ribosomal protein S20 [Alphaproteobacteria bacterium]|nr:30S ribosomal protein S20 [Alphaproteobacteria bacterium]NDC55962.1 30S ribosomal protein S20 [Alphaproteobacteria bacterium]NDG04192.1 30S ribosomal protein S20 [Alphaproteobacteria bacterium]